MASGYTYRPLAGGLGAIRFVTILPGVDDDEIRCELRQGHLDESPVYKALSYVWGNQKHRKQILLDECPFSVTTDLYAGLHCLRDNVQPRLFWIDAICIDQNNVKERSDQVQQMRRVYQGAETVVIWLGEAPKELSEELGRIKALLETLLRGSEQAGYFDNMNKNSDTALGIRVRFLDELLKLVGREITLQCLAFLYHNLYWSRAWTIQEFVLGRRVLLQYGKSLMNFQLMEKVNTLISNTVQDIVDVQKGPDLAQGVDLLLGKSPMTVRRILDRVQSFGILVSLPDRNMNNRVELRKQILTNTPMQLYTLLVENAEAKASEPRDKIFALLSLTPDGCGIIQPDYAKTLTEVSKELTQYLIKQERSLLPLRFGSHERSKTERFPSWCPDWSRTHDKWERGFFRDFACSGQLDPDVRFSEDLEILEARGLGVGLIGHCAKIDGGALPMLKSDKEIQAECVKHRVCPSDPWSENYSTCETYEEALSKVCHLGETNEPFQEGIMTWRAVRDVTAGPLLLFKTYKGLLGRAFDNVKEDDLVCILQGGRAPCVLRKEKKYWVLISQCYGKS